MPEEANRVPPDDLTSSAQNSSLGVLDTDIALLSNILKLDPGYTSALAYRYFANLYEPKALDSLDSKARSELSEAVRGERDQKILRIGYANDELKRFHQQYMPLFKASSQGVLPKNKLTQILDMEAPNDEKLKRVFDVLTSEQEMEVASENVATTGPSKRPAMPIPVDLPALAKDLHEVEINLYRKRLEYRVERLEKMKRKVPSEGEQLRGQMSNSEALLANLATDLFIRGVMKNINPIIYEGYKALPSSIDTYFDANFDARKLAMQFLAVRRFINNSSSNSSVIKELIQRINGSQEQANYWINSLANQSIIDEYTTPASIQFQSILSLIAKAEGLAKEKDQQGSAEQNSEEFYKCMEELTTCLSYINLVEVCRRSDFTNEIINLMQLAEQELRGVRNLQTNTDTAPTQREEGSSDIIQAQSAELPYDYLRGQHPAQLRIDNFGYDGLGQGNGGFVSMFRQYASVQDSGEVSEHGEYIDILGAGQEDETVPRALGNNNFYGLNLSSVQSARSGQLDMTGGYDVLDQGNGGFVSMFYGPAQISAVMSRDQGGRGFTSVFRQYASVQDGGEVSEHGEYIDILGAGQEDWTVLSALGNENFYGLNLSSVQSARSGQLDMTGRYDVFGRDPHDEFSFEAHGQAEHTSLPHNERLFNVITELEGERDYVRAVFTAGFKTTLLDAELQEDITQLLQSIQSSPENQASQQTMESNNRLVLPQHLATTATSVVAKNLVQPRGVSSSQNGIRLDGDPGEASRNESHI